MSSMTAGAFFTGERALVVRTFDVGTPGPGEVLIDVAAAGVCGSDLHQWAGRWNRPEFVPGHEVSGVISQIGPGVQNLTPGDAVTVEPFIYCGRCRYCLAGRYFHCRDMAFLTLHAHGGFAQRMIAPDYAVYRLPDGLSLDTGALCEPCAVAVHGARLGSVCPDDDVLVIGAGTIGLMSVAAAKHLGARRIAAICRYEHQAKAARSLGADVTLAPDQATLEGVSSVFPDGPDVVMEAVGSSGRGLPQALAVAGKMARIVLMGGNTGPINDIDMAPVITKELVIYGSGCYSQVGLRRDFEVALDVLAGNPEAFRDLITHRFPLSRVQEAFETAYDKGRTGAIKVLVEPGRPEDAGGPQD
ncbi:MAG: alcohol dehydrogenase catalytic domain-containing protein [Armatimonadetes bacterium]|nr:alcohol dehydrogenase catalytic domain-containing protein [Armatimonadota bacterium]